MFGGISLVSADTAWGGMQEHLEPLDEQRNLQPMEMKSASQARPVGMARYPLAQVYLVLWEKLSLSRMEEWSYLDYLLLSWRLESAGPESVSFVGWDEGT